MAVSKVIYDGNTLIDLTGDTVTAETLAQGVTAHAASGESITGTLAPAANPTLQSKTVTPKAASQTVTADDGLSSVTVNGDSNLVAANIVSGKTIFGVAGSATTGAKFVTGGFINTSQVTSKVITHGLGTTPNIAIIILKAKQNPTNIVAYIVSESGETFSAKLDGSNIGGKATMNATSVTFSNTGGAYFYGTYRYYIGVI